MTYLVLGIILLVVAVAILPFVCERSNDTKLITRVLLFIVCSGIAWILLSLIYKGLAIVYSDSGLLLIVVLVVTIAATLTTEGLLRKIYRKIYDAGYNSAESAYSGTINDLRKDNAAILQYLTQNGITLPEELYPEEDEGDSE